MKLGVTVNPPATAWSSVTVKVMSSPSLAAASATVTTAGAVAFGLPFTWCLGSADSPPWARDTSWPWVSFSVALPTRCTMMPFGVGFGKTPLASRSLTPTA